MTYLSRYLDGEHERVWDDLLRLGVAAFEEPTYSDAIAVVAETMRRVRANVEELVRRLNQIGFVFGYDHLIQQVLSGASTGSNWRNYFELRRWSFEQPPVFLPAQLRDEVRSEIEAMGLGDIEDDILDGTEALPDMGANIALLDQRIGPVPLSLRVWYERVGAVNLYGYHPDWVQYVHFATRLMNYCDPLQVCVLDDALVHRLLEQFRKSPARHFEFAPDPNFKDNRSGSSSPYDIHWSERAIDGTLPSSQYPNMTFVKYLRMCFKWAGFPGMADWAAVPIEHLQHLTNGLLPF